MASMKDVLVPGDPDYREINTWEQALEELERICKCGDSTYCIYDVVSLCSEMTNMVEYWMLIVHVKEDNETFISAKKASDVFAHMSSCWNSLPLLKKEVFACEDENDIEQLRHDLLTGRLFNKGEEIIYTYYG